MKYKQLFPKSVRSFNSMNKQDKRCSLCDALLKTNHYLLMGKSINETIIINDQKSLTYAECCQRYLNEKCLFNISQIICLKCCENLKNLHLLNVNAKELTKKFRRICLKTKRLNRIRKFYSKNDSNIEIKLEPITNCSTIDSTFIPLQISANQQNDFENSLSHSTMPNTSPIPYSQFLIESSDTNDYSNGKNISNGEEASFDDDQSNSPTIIDEKNETKTTRLTRRQYDFLIELPDQQSLNAFIEASSSESGSRWTWRRTSANSRGYKIYYVCNYSMRRHYHPCPAAIYALFNPEGTISIYSHGKHQHIPKNRLPLSITDESKDEIFKCLQANMSTSDIREHLIRRNLPFGDTKKLNNFIKYHKELLRFGAVTNVRLNGSAYRQPQCWAIRRPSQTINATTSLTL